MRRIAIALLAACGRLHFAGVAGDGAPADAPPDAGPCTAWSAFSTPQLLAGPVNSPSDDWYPTPARGDTQLYFYSFRTGMGIGALYVATRPDRTTPFGTATRITELDPGANETDQTAGVSDDALALVFVRQPSTGVSSIDSTQRSAITDAWAAPAATSLTSGAGEFDPWLSADGRRVVFASLRAPTVGLRDLWEATRPDRASPFAVAVSLSSLQSAANDTAPTLSSDGLEIVFSSTRAGGPGGYDIYTSHRSAIGQTFAPPTLVPELSSPNDDLGAHLSPDGATIYFDYNTTFAGGGNADFYTATRTCLAH